MRDKNHEKQLKPLIVIAGPTATGKSACAIEIAEKINGEIVSADSMQVYKQLDIGTAKPSKEDLSRIPHHLIDIVEPDFNYSAAVFTQMATQAVFEIHEKGKIPILAGGTGFYINALVYNNNFMSTDNENLDKSYRGYLFNMAVREGNAAIYDMLAQVDTESAEAIHENNLKRVIRALEYHHHTGEKFSVYNAREKQRSLAYDAKFYILNKSREQLYHDINIRVDIMVKSGLVNEVQQLKAKGYSPALTSMQGLGYKEIYAYLQGETTLAESVEILKRDTRHFAKRQLTWFRHQTSGHWINTSDFKTKQALAAHIIDTIYT